MTPRNPFPGMNPYLEGNWPDVHLALNAELRSALSGLLPPDLYARAEESVMIDDEQGIEYRYRADVAVTESWRSGIAPAAAAGDGCGVGGRKNGGCRRLGQQPPLTAKC